MEIGSMAMAGICLLIINIVIILCIVKIYQSVDSMNRQMYSVNENLNKIVKLLEGKEEKENKASKSSYSLSQMARQHNNNADSWICSACGEKNPRLAMICKGCGKEK